MRIFYIDPFVLKGSLGGSQISLLSILEAMRKRGHEVSLLVPGKGELAERATISGIFVDTFYLPKLYDTRIMIGGHRYFNLLAAAYDLMAFMISSVSLYRIFKKIKPGIIHSNQMTISIAVGIAARLCRIPCVWHIRENPSTSVPKFVIRIFGLLGHYLADRIIVNSQYTADRFKGSRIFDKIEVVPIGILSNSASSDIPSSVAMRRKFGLPASARIISIFGRLIPMKGHDVLIRTLKHLRDKGHNVHVLVPGHYEKEDTYFLHLSSLVDSLGLSGQVHFLGFKHDIQPILNSSDIVVSCSKEPETFGRTLIEAMAAGKPIVATKIGAHPEIVKDGVTGFLIAPDNPVQLAEKIEELLLSDEMTARIGKAGQARFHTEFTIEASISRIEGIYIQLTMAGMSKSKN